MRRNSFLVLSIALVAFPVLAQTTADQVTEKIFQGERQFVTRMTQVQPFVEAYIQQLDLKDFTPVRDDYMLMKLDLTKSATETLTDSSRFRGRTWFPLRKAGLTFRPSGWARMVFVDPTQFDRATYRMEYSYREFLGDVRCLVFEVSPARANDVGRFIGKIWVEDQDYRIVRFNGVFSGGTRSALYFHLDSWRTNVAPQEWVPSSVYVEEGNGPANEKADFRFKAQVRLWGYAFGRNARMEELSQVLIQPDDPVSDATANDDSPVESQRSWEREAERNVLDKLDRSGLLAPHGEVDAVLDTVVNNLIVTNNIDKDVHCRVLLTTPLETFSIGQTIVISRGLLDVLPDEASLAMVLAEELAHIALAHRTPTSFAFADETMFADGQILDRLDMSRTPEEMDAAAQESMEILSNSPYKDKLTGPGLFLKEIADRSGVMPNLVHANLGNRFGDPKNVARLNGLAAKSPALDESKIQQIAALPLGSRVKVDVWTNRIALVKTAQLPVTSAREKMPLEITPLLPHLTRTESGLGAQQPHQAAR